MHVLLSKIKLKKSWQSEILFAKRQVPEYVISYLTIADNNTKKCCLFSSTCKHIHYHYVISVVINNMKTFRFSVDSMRLVWLNAEN